MQYRHTQIGWPIIIIMGLVMAFLAGLIIANVFSLLPGANVGPNDTAVFAVIFCVLGLITLGFSSLTIEVDTTEVRWFFGPSFWKKRLSLTDVNAIEAIKTPWYCGYGIRLMTDGWLYNASGSAAVALRLNNRTSVYLGSDEPDVLKEAISVLLRK